MAHALHFKQQVNIMRVSKSVLVRKLLVVLPLTVSLAAPSVLSGCATAAVGAAGAAGGIAYTDRGAKGEIKGNTADVNQAAQSALKEMNIKLVGSEVKEGGREREIQGKKGGTDITVKMNQERSDTTTVEVIAREGTIKWNKDMAKNILSKIASLK